MMTFPLDPMTPTDASSPEQNVLLQPSSYQPATPDPTPSTHQASSTETASDASSSSSSSSSASSGGDTVQISYNAQIKQLSSQGMSAADIAQTMGTTVANVDTLLDITPTTTTPSTTSSTTTTTNVTL
ncbi:MAG TPA: hypothetical protein VH250_11685 [Granulicella sp.]|nr:hypothetical protein [Granulicella sp.]